MKTKINKQGYRVAADGRSNVSNPQGRPPKKFESAVRHVQKVYKDKPFTSKEFINTFRLQLTQGKTPANVQAGMLLNKLCKKGVVEFQGLQDNGKVGNNNKVYKLSSK